jgi:hypothetical protein
MNWNLLKDEWRVRVAVIGPAAHVSRRINNAYLRVVINPNDEEALKRIINFPARGLNKNWFFSSIEFNRLLKSLNIYGDTIT